MQVIRQVAKMLETSAKGAQPRGEEAQRVLSVFAASLKNPTLVRARALAACREPSGQGGVPRAPHTHTCHLPCCTPCHPCLLPSHPAPSLPPLGAPPRRRRRPPWRTC